MRINVDWLVNLRKGLALYKKVLAIQTQAPDHEYAEELFSELNQLGLGADIIESNALRATNRYLKRNLNELELSLSDFDGYKVKVPDGTSKSVDELLEAIKNDPSILSKYFDVGGFETKELIKLLLPVDPVEKLEECKFKSMVDFNNQIVETLIDLVSRDLTQPSIMKKFEESLNTATVLDYLLRLFELMNFQEETKVDITLADVKAKIDELDTIVVDGLEQYSAIYDNHVNNPDVLGAEGWGESIMNALKKAGEGFVAAIKNLIEYFTGQKKDLTERKNDLIAECQKQIDALKADQDTKELKKDIIDKTKQMFEKADLPECAGYFGSVNDIPGAIGAFNNAILWLKQNSDNTKDADKALSDAKSAADDVNNFKPTTKDDATAEEKASVKEEKDGLIAKAKELTGTARDKMKECLTPVSALSKLPSIIKNCFTSKETPDVKGTEAWEL